MMDFTKSSDEAPVACMHGRIVLTCCHAIEKIRRLNGRLVEYLTEQIKRRSENPPMKHCSLLSAASAFAFLISLTHCASPDIRNPARAKVEGPIRIVMVGDSMMGGFFGKALAEEFASRPDVYVERDYRISTGLSGLHPFNWSDRTEELFQKHNPDVLIAFFGANDTLAVREKDGKDYLFHHPEFRTRYTRHVDDYVKRFAPRVKRLYLIGQPATDHRTFSARYPVVNDIFREVCSRYPNTFYVPSWEHTTIDGSYAPFMPDGRGKMQKVKYEDAVHPTPAGGIIMKDALLPYFLSELDLKDPPLDVAQTEAKPSVEKAN